MMGPRLEVHTVALCLHFCLLRWSSLPSFYLKSALSAGIYYELGLFLWEKIWPWLSEFSAFSLVLGLGDGDIPSRCFFLIV